MRCEAGPYTNENDDSADTCSHLPCPANMRVSVSCAERTHSASFVSIYGYTAHLSIQMGGVVLLGTETVLEYESLSPRSDQFRTDGLTACRFRHGDMDRMAAFRRNKRTL